jgi:hypothetical protein
MGFHRARCPFAKSEDSLCLGVAEDFDWQRFIRAFDAAMTLAKQADKHLQRCGLYLESRDFSAKHMMSTTGSGHVGDKRE